MGIKVYDNGDMVAMYLDWFNNFLTVARFAEYYGMSENQAESIIENGRELVNRQSYGGPIHKVNVRVNA
jgi:hypothetical protein